MRHAGAQVVVHQLAADGVADGGAPSRRGRSARLGKEVKTTFTNAQHLVGEARQRVLLLHRGGDAHQPRRQHHRPARVAPHAHHHVRLLAQQDAEGLHEGQRQREQPLEQPEQALALEPLRLEQLQRVAGLRHHARLQPARRAREHHLVARMARRSPPPPAMPGKRWPPVPPPAMSTFTPSPPIVCAQARAGRPRGRPAALALSDSSTPAEPIIITSEVPP